MAIGNQGPAARRLTALFRVGATGPLSDGQLLERFASRPGEGAELAFEALVGRHGPLVLRACRSILRDEHAALDAFQATFLVLASKAGSLRVADSLAPWLHAVACRVALCARGSAARRRRHERAVAGVPTDRPVDGGAEAREVGAVLHEEIEALPERFRVPIVLCDLEGRSHDEAARALGWPVGTVKSRQARGRDRLRARLVRRGVAPSAGLGLPFPAGGRLPLAEATAAAAGRVAMKGPGAASAPVASLTQEVLMGFFIGKLKWVSFALMALILAATGGLALARGGVPRGRPAAGLPRTVAVRAEAQPDRSGAIYFGDEGGLSSVDPKTGRSSRLLLRCNNRPKVSPDGRWVAFEWEGAVRVRELERAVEPTKVLDLGDAAFGHPVWSPDGSKLIVSLGRRVDEAKDGGHWQFKTVRLNRDGTGLEELPLPPEDGVADWAPGDLLVTTSSRNAKIGWELYAMKPDGSEIRQVTDGWNPFYARSSPDGKRVLYVDGGSDERRGVWVVGLDGQGRRMVVPVLGARLWSACWSPDGKRIAVVVLGKSTPGKPGEDKLILQEVDGEGLVEFPLEDVKNADMPDWR